MAADDTPTLIEYLASRIALVFLRRRPAILEAKKATSVHLVDSELSDLLGSPAQSEYRVRLPSTGFRTGRV